MKRLIKDLGEKAFKYYIYRQNIIMSPWILYEDQNLKKTSSVIFNKELRISKKHIIKTETTCNCRSTVVRWRTPLVTIVEPLQMIVHHRTSKFATVDMVSSICNTDISYPYICDTAISYPNVCNTVISFPFSCKHGCFLPVHLKPRYLRFYYFRASTTPLHILGFNAYIVRPFGYSFQIEQTQSDFFNCVFPLIVFGLKVYFKTLTNDIELN